MKRETHIIDVLNCRLVDATGLAEDEIGKL